MVLTEEGQPERGLGLGFPQPGSDGPGKANGKATTKNKYECRRRTNWINSTRQKF